MNEENKKPFDEYVGDAVQTHLDKQRLARDVKSAKERYERIVGEKDQNIVEIGFSSVREPGRTIHHFYYVCHSCKDGIKSFQHDNIIIKAVEHMASERHNILLERKPEENRDLTKCGLCKETKNIKYWDTDTQFCKECTSEIFRDPTKHPMHKGSEKK